MNQPFPLLSKEAVPRSPGGVGASLRHQITSSLHHRSHFIAKGTMMSRPRTSDVPPPLTARQLARRRPIPSDAPPPKRLVTRHSSFRLPPRMGTPRLRRDGDRFVLEILQSGRSTGPLIPYDNIPAERPPSRRIAGSPIGRRMDDYRPPHARVDQPEAGLARTFRS